MSNPITPNHYQITTNGKDLIDFNHIAQQCFTEEKLSLTPLEWDFLIEACKYLFRASRKNGIEDIQKGAKDIILLILALENRSVLKKGFLLDVIEKEIEAEEMLRQFMIKSIKKIDETIKNIDEKYPYLKDKQPEEMSKDFLKEDIKVMKGLNATVRQFSNANTTPPTETPFKDALCEYMQEYLKKIKNLRKNIKTIWKRNS